MNINGPRIAIALVIFAAFLVIQRKQKKISDKYLERLKQGPKAEMERLAAQEELRAAEEREAAADAESEQGEQGLRSGEREAVADSRTKTARGAEDGRA